MIDHQESGKIYVEVKVWEAAGNQIGYWRRFPTSDTKAIQHFRNNTNT
jgi:hypothetical protein